MAIRNAGTSAAGTICVGGLGQAAVGRIPFSLAAGTTVVPVLDTYIQVGVAVHTCSASAVSRSGGSSVDISGANKVIHGGVGCTQSSVES